jgi:rod shape determining protein RodA
MAGILRMARGAMGSVAPRRLPWHLPLLALGLVAVGSAFITSAHSAALAHRHLVFAAMGCVGFAAISLLDYRRVAGSSLPLYLAGVALLAALPVLGVSVNDARRSYDLGPFHVQPSEPMKYLLVLALADYFALPRRLDRLRDLAAPLALTAVPAGLIVIQPDLGSGLVLVSLFFLVSFLAGVPVRNLLILVVAGAALFAVAWFGQDMGLPPALRLKRYQKQRVMSFVDPDSAPESMASYNARQAMVAVSAGGLRGQGWGQGVLNLLGRVPERHTDFIFPVIAEEWGFYRTALVVLLYMLIIGLLARLARGTPEPFGRLIVGGVLCLFAVQAMLHVAISLRLAPITGLTLPLVSYGGSSLVSTFAGFGLVASVRMHPTFVFRDEGLPGAPGRG